jgi:thioredoxin-dependent peroxiredoxin
MAQITLGGNTIETIGELPAIGSPAPAFKLVNTSLADESLQLYAGKTVVLNIFPSIDTPTCAMSVRRFNQIATDFNNTVVLCISADLPFAQQRFCGAEGLDKVIPLSVFRAPDFGKDYGLTIKDGPLGGLLSRAVVIIDTSGEVAYTEQVPEIGQEPDYDAALQVLK